MVAERDPQKIHTSSACFITIPRMYFQHWLRLWETLLVFDALTLGFLISKSTRGRRSPRAWESTRATWASLHPRRRLHHTQTSQSTCCLVSKTWVRHEVALPPKECFVPLAVEQDLPVILLLFRPAKEKCTAITQLLLSSSNRMSVVCWLNLRTICISSQVQTVSEP